MEKHICNLSENFTREIKHILIYDATALSFNENLRGLYPPADGYLLKIDVQNISDYHRIFACDKTSRFFLFTIFFLIDLTGFSLIKPFDTQNSKNNPSIEI